VVTNIISTTICYLWQHLVEN